MDFIEVAGSLQYLWMIVFIMIVAGLAKEHNLFAPAYVFVRNVFQSNKIVLVILSTIGGILPISGRVTISAGLLDTIAPKDPEKRQKYGIIDYLATHHYYMWSPLEKTVIIPIATFGITYTAWIEQIFPLLVGTFLFIGWYIWKRVDETDITIASTDSTIFSVIRDILPMIVAIIGYVIFENFYVTFGVLALYYIILTSTWDIKKLISYVNLDVLLIVGTVIIFSAFLQTYDSEFKEAIETVGLNPNTFFGMFGITTFGFVSSFLMGSSGKFVAIAVLMAQVFGIEYFLWFFAVDYSAYLVSPTHKCLMLGNRYFGTPYHIYYIALATWAGILLSIAGTITFLL
jgi:hypothetical protein